jgi:ABC-type methionine transport system ATPase subunit
MIELRNVSKLYDTDAVTGVALHDVSLGAARGRVLAISGGPRAGKSALLRLLGLTETPSAGTLRLFGRAVEAKDGAALRDLRARYRVVTLDGGDTGIGKALRRLNATAATDWPHLLLLDDADLAAETAGGEADLVQLAAQARASRTALVVAGRNPRAFARIADDVALLRHGRLSEFAPATLVAQPANDDGPRRTLRWSSPELFPALAF